MEEMTGVNPADIIGKGDHAYAIPFYGERRPTLVDLLALTDEEIEKNYKFIRKEKNRLTAEVEVPLLRGEKRWLFATASRFFNTNGEVIGSIESVRDITDKKQVEVSLMEFQQQLKNIINFLPDATMIINTEGKVTFWNHAMEEMTGIKATDMIGKGNYEYALPFYGERKPILVDLPLLTEEDLPSELRYRTMMEQLPIAMQVFSTDGILREANKAVEELFNYSAHELIGKRNVLQDEQVKKIGSLPLIERAIKGETVPASVSQFDVAASFGHGRKLWLKSRFYPIKNTVGEVINIVIIHEDITELKQYQLHLEEMIEQRTAELSNANFELLKTNKELQQLDQMKSDFLSTVSHELRTPLTSVLGFAKIIQKRLREIIFPLIKSDEKKVERAVRQVNDNLEIIISEGDRLTTLINDVLDLAKMEAGRTEWKMEPLSVAEIIERSIAATASLFEHRGLKLNKEIEQGLPVISGDRDRLIQTVINLISNAVKFTEQGSVTCRAIVEGETIKVSVIDTGIGIAPGDQEKVFEKFKQIGDTLTDRPQGTGLGLPICQQIVEYHGGRIWVESEPAKGSNFSFTLSVSRDSVSPVSVEKMIDVNSLVKQLKDNVITAAPAGNEGLDYILVVDDESNIRELLRQELEAAGYRVREAKDGIEAIKEVKKELPGLIILECHDAGVEWL